ncbi:MAG: hypothetical protein LQ340_006810 [Diploschistes diacapsis]|nr:MAG: hypothetical protein LQ340_006810 [Diploschistes diacapsis]
MPGLSVPSLPTAIPGFWDQIPLTWGVMARVDGKAYSLMGLPVTPSGATEAILTNAEYTATHTLFELSAGNAIILLDFFSPVTPNDLVRQSMPFSYLTVSATGSSNVQVYTDIDETWTGQGGATISNFTTSSSLSLYELSVFDAKTYAVNGDQALWGTVVFAAGSPNGPAVQSGNGNSGNLRDSFAGNGTLSGGTSGYVEGDVVALAQNVTSSSNATFVIGYVRDPAINFLGNPQAPYYRSVYNDTTSAIQAFIINYPNATSESQALDASITNAAMSVAGSNYSDILTLSVRQSYGSCDVTISQNTLDTNSTLIFVKGISTDGDANTADVLFSTFPIWYVLGPDWIKYTLEPLLRYLQTGQWTLPFFVHDLGEYPNAIGYAKNSADEPRPVEECGNALILAYAYVKATGDTAWASQYTSILQQFAADYLVTNGLNQMAQLSSDDSTAPAANQTNLAIKSAIGLNAFGKMTGMTNYSTVGLNFSNRLYNEGLATDANKTHFQFQYGDMSNTSYYNDTWITTYNLFPDSLFDLSTFPRAAFDMQSSYYPTLFANTSNTDGIPLYYTLDWAKTDWAHFTGAVASKNTRALFIDEVWSFISQNSTDNQVPFSDRWNVTREGPGNYFGFEARPVVGGHFAVLAQHMRPNSIPS